MRRQRFVMLGLGLLAAFAVSIVMAHAQTTAVGPYYATPSWDQKIACTSPSNCARFVVLSNWNGEAVLDRETGLVWERSPIDSVFTFGGAQYSCVQLRAGDRQGWRLPTLSELSSLVDGSLPIPGPSLPPGHPFDKDTIQISPSAYYWTTTSDFLFMEDFVIIKHFTGGGAISSDRRAPLFTSQHYRWCVRGGQGVDAQ
jgi:hypothetical protein